MNCPICNHPNLAEGTTMCPQCNSELEAYTHISGLDAQIKKHKQTILVLGLLLFIVVVAGVFMLSRKSSAPSPPPANTQELTTLKNENAQLQSSINELKKQLEEKQVQNPSPAETQKTSGTYVVKRGESLWMIAQKELGDGHKYTEIAKDNNIANPDKLTIGMELKINK